MMMRTARYPILCALIFVLCSGWGFLVHRTVNQLAVYQLPKTLRAFYYQNLDTVVENAIRPDQRRNSDPTEGTKHFIDLEMFGDSAAYKMPITWDEAVRRYTKDTLVKYGYLPYWVLEMKNRLTNAYRTGNKDSILFYAADIAHYIGDANVPLHTSFYYDGQNTNQRGIHALWESTVPEVALNQYKLSSGHEAKYLENPANSIWQAVRHAHSLLPEMWQQEKEASKSFTDSTKFRVQKLYGRDVKGYTTAFARAYNDRVGKMINDQLIRSSNLVADFWYTAWVDAGKPDLASLSKAEKKKAKKETKSFKKNELVQKKLLISRKVKVADPSVTQ
jgi:hypothetical protein